MEIESSEVRVMGGVPVGMPGYTPGPGYQQRDCKTCGNPAWLGPTQIVLLDTGEMECPVMCMLCMAEFVGAGEYNNPDVRPLVDGDTGSKFDADEFNNS